MSQVICFACNNVVTGQFIRALERGYHKECFKCHDCGVSVCEKFHPFTDDDGTIVPLCPDDFNSRAPMICGTCSHSIMGPYVEAGEKNYHVEHFTCTVCSKVFGPDVTYTLFKGEPYCDKHAAKKLLPNCSGCRMTVSDHYIKVNRQSLLECWHVGCFAYFRAWNAPIRNSDAAIKNISENLQQDLQVKVSRMSLALNTFEESVAICFCSLLQSLDKADYKRCASNMVSIVFHINALFQNLDDVETRMIQGNDCNIVLGHTNISRFLCQGIISLMVFILDGMNNLQEGFKATPKVMDKVSLNCHLIEDLVRMSFAGTFLLERHFGDIDVINNLQMAVFNLSGQNKNLPVLQLANTEFVHKCRHCMNFLHRTCLKNQTTSKRGIILPAYCWHNQCFICSVCNIEMSASSPSKPFGILESDNKLICEKCSKTKKSSEFHQCKFNAISTLNHYIDLMNGVLAGFLKQLEMPETGERYSLTQNTSKVKKVKPIHMEPEISAVAMGNLIIEALEGGDTSDTIAAVLPAEYIRNPEDNTWQSDLGIAERHLLCYHSLQGLRAIINLPETESTELIKTGIDPAVWDVLSSKEDCPKKTKKKTDDEATIFGGSLASLIETSGVASELGVSPGLLLVPLCFEVMVAALFEGDLGVLGIFRKNGNIGRLKLVGQLFNKDPLSAVEAVRKDTAIQNASLLKKFLRELPEPLLTTKLYKLFVGTQGIEDIEVRREVLRYAVCLLPRSNRDVLEILFKLLKKVSEFSEPSEDGKVEGNKMNYKNLAIMIAPNILSAPIECPQEPELVYNTVFDMLTYQQDYWLVPQPIAPYLWSQRSTEDLDKSTGAYGSMVNRSANGQQGISRNDDSVRGEEKAVGISFPVIRRTSQIKRNMNT